MSIESRTGRRSNRRLLQISVLLMAVFALLTLIMALRPTTLRGLSSADDFDLNIGSATMILATKTLTVTKSLAPLSDEGLFVMHANEHAGAEAGNGAIVTATVAVGASVSVSETAGTDTALTNYASGYSCDNGGPSGAATSATFDMPDANVTCTFTNVRKTKTLTTIKALDPLSDNGLFVMHANGNASAEAGDGAIVTATVDVGASVVVSETAGAGVDLANYSSSYACNNDGPADAGTSATFDMPDANVTCTFTNVRKTRTLTTVKTLEPKNDDGLFIMHADAIAGAAAGDGAVAVATVDVGASVVVSETAGALTDLGDYRSSYACDNGGPAGSGTTATFIMPDVDATCVFTNVRTRSVTVTKSLAPVSDDGLFVMHIDDTAGAAAGHDASVVATVDVGASVVVSETAGALTDLANYDSSYACDNGGPSGSGTSVGFSAPNSDVTCTFTNVRKTAMLTVTKVLTPTGDDGLFVMHADGAVGAEGGNGAQITSKVDVGAKIVAGEIAGTLTDLANYTTRYRCDQGSIAGIGTTVNLTMPDADTTCTFTNTRKVKTLLVVNALAPASDPGLFVMDANGTLGAEAGAGAVSSTTIPVGDIATFGEMAGAGTKLANYVTDYRCNDPANTRGIGNYGYLTMPDADVTCTMFNLASSAADLKLHYAGWPSGEVAVGEPFTHTIFVDNLGPAIATNVTVSNTLFGNRVFTLLGVSDDRGACDIGQQSGTQIIFECKLAQLKANARWSISVRVVADAPMDFHSEARVYTNDQADPIMANNRDSGVVRVVDATEIADLKLQSFTVPNGEATVEKSFTYTLFVDNLGPAIATNLMVSKTLFGNGVVTLESVDDNEGACSELPQSGAQISFGCTLGELDVNQRWTINVRVKSDMVMDIQSEARVFNEDQLDPVNANNSSAVFMRVRADGLTNEFFLPLITR